MFAAIIALACGIGILGTLAMVGYIIADVFLTDVYLALKGYYLDRCEERLEDKHEVQVLLMPYISWSDTVAHGAKHTHAPTQE